MEANMKKTLFLIPALALSLSACGYGVIDAVKDAKKMTKSDLADGMTISTTAAKTNAFTKVAGVGPDNIVFVTGDSFNISATGNADVLKHLRYKIKDGQIVIGRDGDDWYKMGDKGATITVTAPVLTALSLSGSGDMKADKMTGEKLVLDLAGSGNLAVADIQGALLEGSLAGSGDVDLAGKVTTANYSLAGSGDLTAAKLTATDAEVSIAGSGNVILNATGKVDASIAGSGDITVTGGAKCKSSTIGSGSVSCS
jgi:hypothetical protein